MANAFHFGVWLREEIEGRGDIAAFIRQSVVSKDAVYRYMREAVPSVNSENRIKIAQALGIAKAEIDARLRAAKAEVDVSIVEVVVKFLLQERLAIDDAVKKAIELGWTAADQTVKTITGKNIDGLARRQAVENISAEAYKLRKVPLFLRNLAAGSWTEPVDVDNGQPDDLIPMPPIPELDMTRVFAVELSGESMLPKYPEEAIVFFKRMFRGKDTLHPGRDYYIQRGDNTATFKKLVGLRDGGATLRLQARNLKKIPGFLDVSWDDVVNCAEAVGVFLSADD